MTGRFRLLIVDDEERVCAILSDFLSRKYQVTTTTDPLRVLDLCDQQPFDMVISDIHMPSMPGPALLAQVKQRHPSIIRVLMTGYNVNDYIHQAVHLNVSNIISKTAPLNFGEIDAVLDILLRGTIFGLRRYLLEDGEVFGTFTIRSSLESRAVRDEIAGIFVKRFGTAGDMNLALDEIITNAVYHAPVNPDGTQKYREFTEVFLEESEYIAVDCAADSEKYGVAVVDNSGALTRETVLKKIDHHLSGAGILDDSGRGLLMSRLLTDRMIINIKPGKRTEVILMNYFTAKYHGYKPLYINEL